MNIFEQTEKCALEPETLDHYARGDALKGESFWPANSEVARIEQELSQISREAGVAAALNQIGEVDYGSVSLGNYQMFGNADLPSGALAQIQACVAEAQHQITSAAGGLAMINIDPDKGLGQDQITLGPSNPNDPRRELSLGALIQPNITMAA